MEQHKEQADSLTAAKQAAMENTSAVLMKAAQRALELLGMPPVESQVVIPASARSTPNQTMAGSDALQVVQIYKELSQVMGGDLALMKAWWHSCNEALHATPNEIARSEHGREKIIDYLGAMASRR